MAVFPRCVRARHRGFDTSTALRVCRLILPADAVITGRSAATLRGVPLALPDDPIEVVAGLETRLFRRAGIDLRRCEVRADEAQPWSRIRVATRAPASTCVNATG